MEKQSKDIQWYDIEYALSKGMSWNCIIGGRGIGKTYSTLRKMMNEDIKFILMRYTTKEVRMCASSKGNPFKTLNRDLSMNYACSVSEDGVGVIQSEDEIKGYVISLQTAADVKSIDYSDVHYIIFDEMIRGKTSRKLIKNPGIALLDFVETVARNRELTGQEPIKIVMLSNATDYESDILMELGLTREFEIMLSKGQRARTIKERDLFIQMPLSNVSEQKKDTSLYKFARGTAYSDMALENTFAYDSSYNVREMPIIEFTPMVSYLSMTIYRHKYDNIYYCRIATESCPHFDENSQSLYKRNFAMTLDEAEICGRIYFENLHAKMIFHKSLE